MHALALVLCVFRYTEEQGYFEVKISVATTCVSRNKIQSAVI